MFRGVRRTPTRSPGRIRPLRARSESPSDARVLAILERTGWGYVALLALCAALAALALGLWALQVQRGLGLAGYQHPVFWGAYVASFVFWVGIAHAGTLISAILYLFRAKWRNAINRAAEVMTVISVLNAMLFLGVHLGRIWKAYFIFPYPNQRALWVNFKSPLVWDTFAINTYAAISLVFLYVGMIPDLAVARDRTRGWRRSLYAALALGWEGRARQWKSHHRAILHLSGLATPLVLSVHSVVSFDFAMALVPGWHATIFAPYFVAGAILSGFAMVLTVMIPVRRIYGLEDLITEWHLENMARFLLLTGTIVAYAYAFEYFIAWYGGVEAERTHFWLRAFGPYWISTASMIGCNALLPQLLWIRRLRTSLPFLFVLSVWINVGMWFERYVIIVSGLSFEHVPAVWGIYTPNLLELGVLAGSFGVFGFLFLVFLKLFPIVAMAEVKELAIGERRSQGLSAQAVCSGHPSRMA